MEETAPSQKLLAMNNKIQYENPHPFIRVDKHGVIIFNNKPARDVVKFISKDKAGLEVNLEWKKILKQQEISTEILVHEQKAGSKHFSFSVTPLTNNSYFNLYGFDVTQKEKYFQELKSAKELAENSRREQESLLIKLSHEIRTPMNGISGFTQILLSSPFDVNQEDALMNIKEASDHLLKVVNEMLELSKVKAGKTAINTETFNLHELFQRLNFAFEEIAEEKDSAFEFLIRKNVSSVMEGDKQKLEQILSSIIHIAFSYAVSGCVELVADLIEVDTQIFHVQFTVTCFSEKVSRLNDTLNLFENFNNKKAGDETLSVGLQLAKEYLEILHSQLLVTIRADNVSPVFQFSLPLKKTTQQINIPTSTVCDSKNKKLAVLLVEDNKINSLLASHILKSWDYEVDLAWDGIEAIDQVKKNKYDIILMDISMPRMDGLETTRHLREMKNNNSERIPIIAMSAHADKTHFEQAIKSGMNDYLSKPFQAEELSNVLSKYINRKNQNLVMAKSQSEATGKSITQNNNIKRKAYNLSYFTSNQVSEKDLINILPLYISDTNQLISQIEKSYNEKNVKEIKSFTHKIKTNVMMLGIEQAWEFIRATEKMDENEPMKYDLDKIYFVFNQSVKEAINQLEADFRQKLS